MYTLDCIVTFMLYRFVQIDDDDDNDEDEDGDDDDDG